MNPVARNPQTGGNRFQRERSRPKNTAKTLLRLLGYFREQWYVLPLIFALSIGATAGALIGPFLIGRVIDSLVYPYPALYVTRFALPIFGLLIGLYFWDSTAQFLQNWVVAGASQRLVRSMRRYLFAHLQKLPIKFFDRYMHGELMSRLSNDTDNIAGILGMALVQLTAIIVTVTGVLGMMLWLSPAMTFFALVSVPFFFVVSKTIGAKTRGYFRAQQLALGLLNAKIEEDISGLAVIKAYGAEEKCIHDFAQINEALRIAGTNAQIWSGFIMPAMNMINNLSLTVVAFAGAVMAINGHITVGLIAAFIVYARQFGRPLNDLASTYNQLQSALASTERVFEILDEAEETPDYPSAQAITNVRGDVVFRGVSFGYDDDKPILTDFNFSAKAGETIALVGPTGAGKTTIVNILTRFYDIQAGEITIDGLPLTAYTRDSLRRVFGIVLQETYLFTGTIMENLRYGKPTATTEDVKKAAKWTNADHFIRQLPAGYDTLLTENSRNLSSGQRQLLAITRCVLANPDMLILDEATSSVDTRTEVKIQKAMQDLMQGRTSFVIAHRLRTIADADLILFIDQGKIVEQGNHQALMVKKGAYYRMFELQAG